MSWCLWSTSFIEQHVCSSCLEHYCTCFLLVDDDCDGNRSDNDHNNIGINSMNDSRYHIHHHRFDHRRLYASFLSCRNASHGASRPLITMPDGEIDIEAFLKEIDEVLGVADTEDEDEGMAGHHLDDSMYEDQSYPN